jgi:chromosome segregation ATPase
LKRLELQYQNLPSVRESVEADGQTESTRLSELEKQFEEAQSTFHSRKVVLRLVKQSIQELASDVGDVCNLSAQIRALRDEVAESEAVIGGLVEQRSVLDEHLSTLKEKSSTQKLASECEALRSRLKVDEAKLESFASSMEKEVEKEQNVWKRRGARLDAQLEKLMMRKSQLENEFARMKSTAEDLEEDLGLSEATVADIRRARAELVERLRSVAPDNVETLLRIA